MTLTEFLLARIAEDEAMAQRGAGTPVYPHFGDTAAEECVEMAENESCSESGVAYLRRLTPARVLAECEAKRRIVEFVRPDPSMPVDSGRFVSAGVLSLLTIPYADHPDCRDEWKP